MLVTSELGPGKDPTGSVQNLTNLQTGKFFDLPGVRAYVDARGEGPTALFVHGLEGDTGTWSRVWQHLQRNRRHIRYDLRDFGLSTSKSNDEFTHANDLADLLEALGIQRCDLVGVSMGAGVALTFALDHPERVNSLTLVSPQISGWEWSDTWQKQWELITDAATSGNLPEARRLLWDHPMFASTRATAAAEDLREEIGRFEGRSWMRNNHALVMPDIERLHELQPPTLLLSGTQDVEEFALMADILEASTENVERRMLTGGHLLHMEEPAQCAEIIDGFLDKHSPRS